MEWRDSTKLILVTNAAEPTAVGDLYEATETIALTSLLTLNHLWPLFTQNRLVKRGFCPEREGVDKSLNWFPSNTD